LEDETFFQPGKGLKRKDKKGCFPTSEGKLVKQTLARGSKDGVEITLLEEKGLHRRGDSIFGRREVI